MKKVLCFGDSNTYGYNPYTGLRYDKNTRWTGILKSLSKNQFEIVEAGRNNRTAFSDNTISNEMTGYKILPRYYDNSFDILILSLGANDLQKAYNVELEDFYDGILKLINLARNINKNAKILLVAPSYIKKEVTKGRLGELFEEDASEKSKKLPEIYFEIAKKENLYFIDLNKIAEVEKEDGLHFSSLSHRKIADKMYDFLLKSEI